MSAAAAVIEPELMELHEAIASLDTPGLQEAVESHGRADGLVPLVIIRPGLGKGKGRHVYEASMLSESVQQGRFTGWKMYLDHQNAEAKKKAGGLPRSIRDLGGIVKEAWWDPNFSTPQDAANGHDRGAVLGLAKPNRFMRALIEDLPEAIGASISATATNVRPVNRGGQTAWLVEGINPRGSVDWVTEAGAGGKVVSLMESLEESFNDDEELSLMEGKSDEELLAYLRENRPELVEALATEDEVEETATTTPEGGDDVEITPEALTEALSTEEGQAVIEPIVNALFDKIVAPRLGSLIEAALEDERELMQSESNALANRRLQVRDLRDAAHAQIRESRLIEAFQVPLLKKYDIVDGTPTPALNVVDVREGTEVVKTAEELLREQVAEDIEEQRTLIASARPTRVVGQGPRGLKEEAGEKTDKEEKTTGSSLTDKVLTEAKFSEDDFGDMYEGIAS